MNRLQEIATEGFLTTDQAKNWSVPPFSPIFKNTHSWEPRVGRQGLTVYRDQNVFQKKTTSVFKRFIFICGSCRLREWNQIYKNNSHLLIKWQQDDYVSLISGHIVKDNIVIHLNWEFEATIIQQSCFSDIATWMRRGVHLLAISNLPRTRFYL